MKRKFKAKINWLSEIQGGRRSIPFGNKYAPIIKISKSLYESETFWSAFVTNTITLSEYETLANIEYLADDAPDNLAVGVEFILYEGKKNVGKGVVLQEIQRTD